MGMLEEFQRAGAIARAMHDEALGNQQGDQRLAQLLVVVDNKDGAPQSVGATLAQAARQMVPWFDAWVGE